MGDPDVFEDGVGRRLQLGESVWAGKKPRHLDRQRTAIGRERTQVYPLPVGDDLKAASPAKYVEQCLPSRRIGAGWTKNGKPCPPLRPELDLQPGSVADERGACLRAREGQLVDASALRGPLDEVDETEISGCARVREVFRDGLRSEE